MHKRLASRENTDKILDRQTDRQTDRQHNSVSFHIEFFNRQKYIPNG